MERKELLEKYKEELKKSPSPKLKDALENAIIALENTSIPMWYIKKYVDDYRYKDLKVVTSNTSNKK